jgi:glutathione peroxidase
MLPGALALLDLSQPLSSIRSPMSIDRRTMLAAIAMLPAAGAARAASRLEAETVFPSIDGGTLDLADYRGGPVLLVNTASRCGSTPQYDALQALWERYRARGLTVVGVPSRSFGQELGSAGAVKEFCEVNFAIDFPMTGLVDVAGSGAHPFYARAAREGFGPTWNFHKILIDGEGAIVAAFDRFTPPEDPKFLAAVEALLLGA